MSTVYIPFEQIRKVSRASILDVPIDYSCISSDTTPASDIVPCSDGSIVRALPVLRNAQDATINNDSATILTSRKNTSYSFNESNLDIKDNKPLLKNTVLKIYKLNPAVTTTTYTSV